MEELETIFPEFTMFEKIVAENGALVHTPATHGEELLSAKPPEIFIETLRKRGVERISEGKVIVATWHPYEQIVLETIRDLGLELQVIFNKDAVMILPTGVNKATGLTKALTELGLSHHNVVGIGDAENDHAFLSFCECGVSVANGLPSLKERADLVTNGDHGAGVTELIDRMIANDLADLAPKLSRHEIHMGTGPDGEDVRIPAHGASVLIAGTSGGGKSTMAQGILERLADHEYQYCIIDPEGDYSTLEGAVILGNAKMPPDREEFQTLLKDPAQNVVLNMIGISLDQRPAFFESFLPGLQELRTRNGRPHWILVDETHHLVPAAWETAHSSLPRELSNTILITVHPEHVSTAILSSVDIIIAIGAEPDATIANFSKALEVIPPAMQHVRLESGEGIIWYRTKNIEPFWFKSTPPRTEKQRHFRKYVEGELEPEQSFYFRGPEGKLQLRAQNLQIFIQLAEGVDDETWEFHLRNGDISDWLKKYIKDNELVKEIEEIERVRTLSPAESRAQVRTAIEKRFTASA